MTDLPPIRESLERHGLLAKKSLGQHFLLDLNLTRRIARSAGDIRGKPVLEIGPGPGGLTRALLESGAAPLIVIEKDKRFIPLLEELHAYAGARLKILEGDALGVDEPSLLATTDTPAHIVSNLPYNVATPLLIKWLRAGVWRGPMTLMLQKEVAERVAAQPRSSGYGRLSIIAQTRCVVRMGFTVPARAFTPPPKVDSAIVHLENRLDPYAYVGVLERVTAAAFGQRRKMLRQALKGLGEELGLSPTVILSRAGIPPTSRAEEIGLDDFIALTEVVRNEQA